MKACLLNHILSLGASLIIQASHAHADEKYILDSEPVIASCQKEKICICRETGGDVYNEGLKIRCTFKNKTTKDTYSYFIKHHTNDISELLPRELESKNFNIKIKNRESEDIEIDYRIDRKTGKTTIRMDYINGGYGYVITPQKNSTILDFLYFSYN